MTNNPIRILHVEDDPFDACMVGKMFKRIPYGQTYEIVNITNIRTALNELQREEYDVVLLDLSLSDIKGLDNIAVIKAQNNDIPIVVLSGDSDRRTIMRARKTGADEFISKSECDLNILDRCIRSSINKMNPNSMQMALS